MKWLVVDWRGLCWGEGGVRLRRTCLCPLSDQGHGDAMLCNVWFGGNKLCAGLHRFAIMTLPSVASKTGLQPSKHVAGRLCYTTQGRGDASTGLSHQASSVASVKAASAWREWDWSYGSVHLIEGRKGHIHQPPLCYGSPGPLFSLPLSLITEVSAEGDSRGELFPCKFTLLPPENTGKTAERHEREAARAHFELFVMLPYFV